MRRFYMIFAALLLIGSVCFAQKTHSHSISERHFIKGNSLSVNNSRETGWYGSSELADYLPMTEGEFVIIRPETYQGATTEGDQLSKVKFYTLSPTMLASLIGEEDAADYAEYTNMSFSIKIYEGSEMDEELLEEGYTDSTNTEAVLGTLVRTISYTATAMGEQLVEFEPYTITSENYWIALECNGSSLLVLGVGEQVSNTVTPEEYDEYNYPELNDDAYANAHYLFYQLDSYKDIDVFYDDYYTDESESAIATYLIDAYFQIFIQGSEEYVPSSDLEALFFDTYPNATGLAESTVTLGSTEDLTLYPAFMNLGPDAVTAPVTIDITINNNSIFEETHSYAFSEEENASLPNGMFLPINFSETEGQYAPLTIPAAAFDAIEDLPETFDICLTVTYTGDEETENNTACITVTREAAEEEIVNDTITATANEGGSITPAGEVVLVEGQDTAFTITPDACYRIESVMVDGVDTTASLVEGVFTFTAVEGNHTIEATFAKITYEITVTADENGTITHLVDEVATEGNATVNCGEDIAFTIAANDSCRLVSLKVDDVDTVAVDGVFTFTEVVAAHTIAATFQRIPTYTITASANEFGTIAPAGENTVLEGESKSFTITANDSCRLVSVIVDADTENEADVTAELEEGVYTFPEVNANHTIAATFQRIPTYTITATADDNGTISPAEIVVLEGENAAFTVAANEGYRILSVIVDADTENENDVTEDLVEGVYTFENVDADHTIAATFKKVYEVTITVEGEGTVTPDGTQIVDENANFEFTVEAANCYELTSVTVNGDGDAIEAVDNVYTIAEITEAKAVVVTFSQITYNITVDAGENGHITHLVEEEATDGNVVVNCGESITFAITPDDGYMIDKLFVDGEEVATTNTYTFSSVADDHTIAANFVEIPEGHFVVVVNAAGNGTVEPMGTQLVPEGDSLILTITPADCYKALVNGEVVELEEGNYTIVPTANMTINVSFEQITYAVEIAEVTNGTITANDENGETAICGEDKAFTIAAADCYRIASVTVDGVDTTASVVDGVFTFTNVNDDHSIAATFEMLTYTITVNAGENGTITHLVEEVATEGDATVNCGADIAFTINANDSCRLVSLKVDDVDTVAVDGVFTFTEVNADHTIEATFERIPTYTITVAAAENGTITPEGEVTVLEGEDVAFTIIPAEGFMIDTVYVDGIDTTASVVDSVFTFVNVRDDHTIAAVFVAEEVPVVTYTITATAGENGTIDPAGEVEVNAGENKEFTITANEGFHIVSVIVDADENGENGTDVTESLVEGVYTFENVTADHTIAATFAADEAPVTYIITATAGENGTIDPSGEVVVNAGADQAFVITPAENYQIDVLTVDGEAIVLTAEEVLAAYTYTFEAVDTAHSINVTFVPVTSVEIVENGSIAVYPNPNNGMFSIDFSSIEGDATYQLIDARGAVVETRDINVMNGETMYFSNDLKAGTYFVRIIAADKVYVEQIVVE